MEAVSSADCEVAIWGNKGKSVTFSVMVALGIDPYGDIQPNVTADEVARIIAYVSGMSKEA